MTSNHKISQAVESVEHDAAGLLDEILAAPSGAKSEFELLLDAPAILPDRAVEIPQSEQASYPAENSAFSSITQYAPEPEPKKRRMVQYCVDCGCVGCLIGKQALREIDVYD